MKLTCTDETGGCLGDCCSGFSLSKAVQLTIMSDMAEDGAIIRNMLIPLEDGNFTCKHWHDNRCTIYAWRPQMCRDFPEKGNPCGAPGCKEPNH